MIEREGLMTREEILSAFPPQKEIITGKNGEVPYFIFRNPNLVSQDPEGLILCAVPEVEWLKRGEQQENQAAV